MLFFTETPNFLMLIVIYDCQLVYPVKMDGAVAMAVA